MRHNLQARRLEVCSKHDVAFNIPINVILVS